MKYKNLILLTLVCLHLQILSISAKEPVLKLKQEWNFKTGDNLDYAKDNFDDSGWKFISVDKVWELQGYSGYDGYAWYRTKIVIPSSLKHNSHLKDSLRIYLGKIDDYDQVFINGQILGINGKVVNSNSPVSSDFINEQPIPWNKERYYRLSDKDPRIKWDKINTIAVRVYDQGGDGGMYYGLPCIAAPSLKDYFVIDNFKNQFEFRNDSVSKTIYIRNISAEYTIKGKLSIISNDETSGKTNYSRNYYVTLGPNSTQDYSYLFPYKNRRSNVVYNFVFSADQNRTEVTDNIPYILTPPDPLVPKINGAKVYGQRTGRPFLYTIAATGRRPMSFDAYELPKGLTIDKNSGIISGSVSEKGEYKITLSAKNEYGEVKSILQIFIGDKIALTPQMGWNSWNVWGISVDQGKVIASAKAFKQKGLLNHGWTYINIDDGWEIEGSQPDPKRDADGNILCNSKFPDMKALGDSIHALGLKYGIYSSPGPLTCGNYTASYQHEMKDAKSYSSWGIDYLKYDWCSYDKIAKDHSLPELQKPYYIMNDALKQIDRDILFSLCQYGMGDVWEWGNKVGGNSWRTTGDITDTWKSMSSIGFSQVKNASFAKPGNWNDPDMLVVGWVGWGPSLHQTRLTPDEQYTHISLWCMLSAPLLIGCDLTKLDDFTLNLLTNDEVLAIDQDPLGRQAIPKVVKGNIQIWVKELENGDKAVGIFNLGNKTQKAELNFSEIGAASKIKLRNLWTQKDLGTFTKYYRSFVPPHGVVLLKVFDK